MCSMHDVPEVPEGYHGTMVSAVLLQNVFPLFPCNWLAILFPKLYHGRKPVSRLPEALSIAPSPCDEL
jgi:hypothetical protein